MSDRDEGIAVDWAEQPFGRLIDHIVNTHHAYLYKSLPDIKRHLQTIDNIHGSDRPELARIRRRFTRMMDELLLHLPKEEMDLFPLIRKLDHKPDAAVDQKCKRMIEALEDEHDGSIQALVDIRRLAQDYALPEDACPTYRMAYAKLEELESDMHRHIELEDKILFPRALEALDR